VTLSPLRAPRPSALPADGELGHVRIGALPLEDGTELADVTIAFKSWGTLSPARDNVVLALHALTGDAHAAGTADEHNPAPGWWDGLIGPGLALDTDRWCVIATNVVGGCGGSTGPASPAPDGRAWGSRFPMITVRDQVRAERMALAALGIESVAAVMGGSMGGARALEWALTHPDEVGAALVVAVGARATADQIGTQTAQIQVVTADPHWQGGDYHHSGRAPEAGLGLARRFAHLTYRSESELDHRFANLPQDGEDPRTGGRYAVQSYLDHQAGKLMRRFDAGSYVVLTESLNRHDVGAGRGGVEAALAACTVPTIVAGFTSDRLYPVRLQEELAASLGDCRALHIIDSRDGHDAFLTEFDHVAALITETLDLVPARD